MFYIYMDNFRGFSKTLIPIQDVNFLVGENSTGKTSFLNLFLQLFRPEFSLHILPFSEEFGGFSDMVSAWSDDDSYFRVGFVEAERTIKTMSIFSFENSDGAPDIRSRLFVKDDQVLLMDFGKDEETGNRKCEYRIKDIDLREGIEDVCETITDVISSEMTNKNDLELLEGVVGNVFLPGIFQEMDKKEREKGSPVGAEGFFHFLNIANPLYRSCSWFAPIRSSPKRVYDGLNKSYSAEGEHTPFLLKDIGEDKSAMNQLSAFGEKSGLFQSAGSHSFGEGKGAPFEILVTISGKKLNISNVGYGVSQVLPLVVEFVVKHGKMFGVQQPEVHLHPKAQAAFGELVYDLSANSGHKFLIETHSDYLVDRYRLSINKKGEKVKSQIIFFERTDKGNKAHVLPITDKGGYPEDQPEAFREFFVKEALEMLKV